MHPTRAVYEYDGHGNITRVTDALGGITTSTYDAEGNVLSETNALGKTTTYTYDARGNLPHSIRGRKSVSIGVHPWFQ